MSLEFPFEYAQVEGLGRLFYPMVKASLKTISGWIEFQFLVDTGADITVIPSHLLSILGFKKSMLHENITFGVGGFSIKTYVLQIPILLGKKQLKIHCSAVESKNDSMPLLLGRKDIFEEKFNLLLDSKRLKTVITSN